jgi:hypothetical protein
MTDDARWPIPPHRHLLAVHTSHHRDDGGPAPSFLVPIPALIAVRLARGAGVTMLAWLSHAEPRASRARERGQKMLIRCEMRLCPAACSTRAGAYRPAGGRPGLLGGSNA